MKRRLLFCLFLISVSVASLVQADSDAFAPNLFKDSVQDNKPSPFGLLVTPLNTPSGQPPSSSTTNSSSVSNSPSNSNSQNNWNDPVRVFNNFLNTNVMRQIGVGVHLSF